MNRTLSARLRSVQWADAVINVDEEIPSIETSTVSWTATLPSGPQGIDAFRLWNIDKQLFGFQTFVDDVLISAEAQLLKYCDGLPHTIGLVFTKATK